MSAFRTDPLLDPDVAAMAQRMGTTNEPPPVGVLDNVSRATIEGVPRGVLEAQATAQSVFGLALSAARSAGSSMNFTLDPEQYEAGLGAAGFERFRAAEEEMQRENERTEIAAERTLDRAEAFRPDPMETGAAGQIGNEVFALLPRTIAGTVAGGPVGGALAAGGPAGQAEAHHREGQGVDPGTARDVGVITGVSTAVGTTFPATGFSKGIVRDALIAAGLNAGLGATERGANARRLREAGYSEQAAVYDAWDRTAIGADVGLSLLLSGAHVALRPRQRDALLVGRNGWSFATGDGLAALDPKGAAVVADAKASALNALIDGEPVDVGSQVADVDLVRDPFRAPPALPPEVARQVRTANPEADVFDRAAERIITLESGGRADAKNPRSSATGAGQFIDKTWLDLMRRHRPDLVAFKSTGEILAMRTDPDLAREMVEVLARDNGDALARAGVEATSDHLYAAHHFGPDAAIKFARAGGDTPMTQILSAGKVSANPYLAKLTKADLLANWARRAPADAERGPTGSPTVLAAADTPDAIAPRPLTVQELQAELDSPATGPARRRGVERLLASEQDLLARQLETIEPGVTREGGALQQALSKIGRVLGLTDDPLDATATGDAPAATTSDAPALPADPLVASAQQLAAEMPDHPILSGYDAEGFPTFRPLREAMAELQTDYQLARREADAYDAGARCFLRRM